MSWEGNMIHFTDGIDFLVSDLIRAWSDQFREGFGPIPPNFNGRVGCLPSDDTLDFVFSESDVSEALEVSKAFSVYPRAEMLKGPAPFYGSRYTWEPFAVLSYFYFTTLLPRAFGVVVPVNSSVGILLIVEYALLFIMMCFTCELMRVLRWRISHERVNFERIEAEADIRHRAAAATARRPEGIIDALMVDSGLNDLLQMLDLHRGEISLERSQAFRVILCMLTGMFTAPRRSEGHGNMRIAANYFSFTAPFLEMIVKAGLKFPVKEVFIRSESSLMPSFEWLEGSENLLKNWSEYKDSPLGKSFMELVSFAMVIPLIQENFVQYDTPHYYKRITAIQNIMKHSDVSMTGVLNSLVYVLRTLIQYCHSGSLVDTIEDSEEVLYAECKYYQTLLGSGNYAEKGLTLGHIDEQFRKCEVRIKKRLSAARGVMENVYTERLAKILQWKDELSLCDRDGKPCRQPISFTLYGPPGIGKTCLVEFLLTDLHRIFDMADIKQVNHIKEGDKYQSTGGSQTTAWIFDDLGGMPHNKRDISTVRTFLDMCSSTTMPLVKAGVDDKGKCFNNAHFICVTTNLADADINPDFNVLEAGVRRLGIKIHMSPKPGILDANGQPDPVKMAQHRNELIPSFCTYRPYTIKKKNNGFEIEYLTEALEAKEFYNYFIAHAQIWRANQDISLERLANVATYSSCPHGFAARYCCHCDPSPKTAENIRAESDICGATRRYVAFHMLRAQALYKKSQFLYNCVLGHYAAHLCVMWFVYPLFVTWVLFVSRLYMNYRRDPSASLIFVRWYLRPGLEPHLELVLLYVLLSMVLFLITIPRRLFKRVVLCPMENWCETIRTISPEAKRMFAGLAIISGAFLLVSKYFVTEVFPESNTDAKPECKSVDVQTGEVSSEPPPTTCGPTWVKPVRLPGVLTPTSLSTSPDQIRRKLKSSLTTFVSDDEQNPMSTQLFWLNKHIVLAASHIFDVIDADAPVLHGEVTLTFHREDLDPITMQRKIELRKDLSYIIPGSDVVMIRVPDAFGDRPDWTNRFVHHLPGGSFTSEWIKVRDDSVESSVHSTSSRVKCEYDAVAGRPSRRISLQHAYAMDLHEHSRSGDCGSIVCLTEKGFAICGIYVAGSKEYCQGFFCGLTIPDLELGLEYFRSRGLYISPVERSEVINHVADRVVPEVPVHHNNPVNFQENQCLLINNVAKTKSPRSNVVPNAFFNEAHRILKVEHQFGSPRMKDTEAFSKLLHNAIKPIQCPNPTLLTRALNDYASESVITECLRRCRLVTIDGVQCLPERPLEVDEAMNGIAGNKFVPSMNFSTSAGFPFNTKKRNVLSGEDGDWYMDHELLNYFNDAMFRLRCGASLGTIYNATLKSEPLALSKESNLARTFQCVSMFAYIAMKMYIGPLLEMMSHCPDLFEIAIGLNSQGPAWDENMSEFYEKEWISDEDYSAYDQNLHEMLRTAGAAVFVRLAKAMQWPPVEVTMLEHVCNEFLHPVINLNGACIVSHNLQPSGCNPTAHLNSIVNSIIQRMSFFKRVPESTDFRSSVVLRTLGDDVIKATNDDIAARWTPLMTAQDLAEFGVAAKPGDKQGTLDKWKPAGAEIAFLKRFTYYNEDLGRLVAVLASKSLMRPFDMVEKSQELSAAEHQLNVIEVTNRENFFKGKTEYELGRSALQEYAGEVTRRGAIPGCVRAGTLGKSYEEMVELDRQSYGYASHCPRFAPRHVPAEYLHFSHFGSSIEQEPDIYPECDTGPPIGPYGFECWLNPSNWTQRENSFCFKNADLGSWLTAEQVEPYITTCESDSSKIFISSTECLHGIGEFLYNFNTKLFSIVLISLFPYFMYFRPAIISWFRKGWNPRNVPTSIKVMLFHHLIGCDYLEYLWLSCYFCVCVTIMRFAPEKTVKLYHKRRAGAGA
jgi:hypothetical protein